MKSALNGIRIPFIPFLGKEVGWAKYSIRTTHKATHMLYKGQTVLCREIIGFYCNNFK